MPDLAQNAEQLKAFHGREEFQPPKRRQKMKRFRKDPRVSQRVKPEFAGLFPGLAHAERHFRLEFPEAQKVRFQQELQHFRAAVHRDVLRGVEQKIFVREPIRRRAAAEMRQRLEKMDLGRIFHFTQTDRGRKTRKACTDDRDFSGD